MPVDVSDAEMIEEAICALRSIAERSLMISWYVQGRNKYEIARRLRFEVEFFEAFRRRTIVRLGEFVASRTGVKLIRRGRPIWAGLAK